MRVCGTAARTVGWVFSPKSEPIVCGEEPGPGGVGGTLRCWGVGGTGGTPHTQPQQQQQAGVMRSQKPGQSLVYNCTVTSLTELVFISRATPSMHEGARVW
jgi:hypothetical protein